MSFTDFIVKLQKKPRWIKVQIMWVSVTICMIVIFGFWFWAFKSEMRDIQQHSAKQEQDSVFSTFSQLKKDIPTLWQTLGAGISSIFDSAGQGLDASTTLPSSTNATSPPEQLPVE